MVFPIVAPPDPRDHDVTILNLHYIKKFPCKYNLFWLGGSGEDFQMTPPHFCIFVIISPIEEDLALYLNN
jgi:hypothetical protein